MIYIIALLIVSLFIKEIVLPVISYNEERKVLAYQEEYKFHKLKVVKTFYPSLRGLSYDEINEKYNVNRVYHSVGRFVDKNSHQ